MFCIKFVLDNKKVTIVSVYRSPTGDYELFLENLSYVLQCCCDDSDHVFICDDLNIDYLSESSYKQHLLDLLDCFDLKVATSKPSRVFSNIRGKTSISQIDYIITSSNIQPYSEDVIETHFSDHRAI
ncbi:hypothetical protein WA026_016630 [Henosepilachna vigintioctopunctata]|uniref:Endonuclease/exonuclease/phosphatase domain-containing protein n=1 Tax=Henosepilachna vigintioctopunctata TaxID=420089 RepID=A0AAW1VF21_9CUCU